MEANSEFFSLFIHLHAKRGALFIPLFISVFFLLREKTRCGLFLKCSSVIDKGVVREERRVLEACLSLHVLILKIYFDM